MEEGTKFILTIIFVLFSLVIASAIFKSIFRKNKENDENGKKEKNNTVNLQQTEGETKKHHNRNYFFALFIFTQIYQGFIKDIAPHSLSAPIAFFVTFLEVILDVGFLYFLVLWIMDAIRRRGGVERKENKKVKLAVNIIFTIILILNISSIVLVFLNQPSYKADEAVERVTDYFTSEEWKDFNSTIGQFKALFPSYPAHETNNIPVSLYGIDFEMKLDNYIAAKGNVTYFVGVATYSIEMDMSSDPDGILENALNGMLVSSDSELISSSFTSFNEYRALNFLLLNRESNLYVKGKTILTEQTLYEIMISYENKDYNASDYEKFINSFQLTK